MRYADRKLLIGSMGVHLREAFQAEFASPSPSVMDFGSRGQDHLRVYRRHGNDVLPAIHRISESPLAGDEKQGRLILEMKLRQQVDTFKKFSAGAAHLEFSEAQEVYRALDVVQSELLEGVSPKGAAVYDLRREATLYSVANAAFDRSLNRPLLGSFRRLGVVDAHQSLGSSADNVVVEGRPAIFSSRGGTVAVAELGLGEGF